LFNGGDTNLYGYGANDPINNIDPDGLSYLVYHSGSNSLQVYSDDERLLQTFSAYNNAQRSSNGPFPPGQFPFDRVSDHTGADASSNGRYGPNGNFIFNVPGRTNMGVHSGRAGSCDAANRCGSQYSTNGCIRTSDDATSFLRNLNGTDPIRFIRVEQ
jgi:uncharacterized protein RhaS with RHS repeats